MSYRELTLGTVAAMMAFILALHNSSGCEWSDGQKDYLIDAMFWSFVLGILVAVIAIGIFG